MLEDNICTKRESLLGSMAWRQDFWEEMRARPNFLGMDVSYGKREDRCEICGRSSHSCAFQVGLSGPRYDSQALWESSKWVDALPCSIDVLGTPAEKVAMQEKAEEEERDWAEEEEVSWYNAGSTCKYKTQCYSVMMHYKYRLVRRVARRLKGFTVGGGGKKDKLFQGRPVVSAKGEWEVVMSVDGLLQEGGWLDMEYERLERLLGMVERYILDGGAKETHNISRLETLWSDDEGGGGGGGGRRRSQVSDDEEEEEDERRRVPGRRGYNPLL